MFRETLIEINLIYIKNLHKVLVEKNTKWNILKLSNIKDTTPTLVDGNESCLHNAQARSNDKLTINCRPQIKL